MSVASVDHAAEPGNAVLIAALDRIERRLQAGQPPVLSLSISQAAAALGVSATLVKQLIRQEGLPVAKLGGRTVIPLDRLRRWLDARTEQHASDEALTGPLPGRPGSVDRFDAALARVLKGGR